MHSPDPKFRFAFTVTHADEVQVCGFGSGGFEEMKTHLKDMDIWIGFLKISEGTYGLLSYISIEITSNKVSSALYMQQEARMFFTVSFSASFSIVLRLMIFIQQFLFSPSTATFWTPPKLRISL